MVAAGKGRTGLLPDLPDRPTARIAGTRTSAVNTQPISPINEAVPKPRIARLSEASSEPYPMIVVSEHTNTAAPEVRSVAIGSRTASWCWRCAMLIA